MSTIIKYGKIVKFGSGICQVSDDRNLFGVDIKFREIFYLNYRKAIPSSYATDVQEQQSVEDTQHHRYKHLGSRNLEKLAKDELIDGFNYIGNCMFDVELPNILGRSLVNSDIPSPARAVLEKHHLL